MEPNITLLELVTEVSSHAGSDGREGDAPKAIRGRSSEGRGRLFGPPVHAAEGSLSGDDEERHGHEGLGHDRAGGREGQVHSEGLVQPLPIIDQA